MKNQVFFTCFWVVLCSVVAFGQSGFAAIGTQWTYTQWVPGPNTAFGTFEPYYMKVDSEVVFQDRLCRRLIGGRASQPQLIHFFLYNEGDSVFWWDWYNDRFNLLYDFSAETGDSWEIEMPHGSLPKGDTTITVLVDSMSYMVMNNDTFKVWHISYNEWADWSDILIEGIGSTCYMIPSPDIHEFNVCGLRCFENTLTDVNFVNHPCDTIISTIISSSEDPADTGYIKMYPNPAADQVTLEYPFGNVEALHLELFDITGKRLYFKSFKNDGGAVFDVSNLINGLYYLRVSHGEQVLKHFKVSVVH
jgi:Secretion system C-terminal sorting domain